MPEQTPTENSTGSQASDSRPVKARLYTVSDPIDRPVSELIQGESSVEVQFNPASLKVALSNSLKENERSGNTRAAQYVDSSSSNLTVELIFDTTMEVSDGQFTDVRSRTGQIANTFMAPDENESDQPAPKRCLFQWGAFAFVGIMESFDETLDFFSAEGTPLRATVSIKLTESRFQFRTAEAQTAEQTTPQISPIPPDTPITSAAGNNAKKSRNWRDNAMFNGIESPRLSGALSISTPKLSLNASVGACASGSFSFGASSSLGTGVTGAFNVGSSASFNAGSLINGSASPSGQNLSLAVGENLASRINATTSRNRSSMTASTSLPRATVKSSSVGFD